MSWPTLHHDIRWNVVISGLRQLTGGGTSSAVATSPACAHIRDFPRLVRRVVTDGERQSLQTRRLSYGSSGAQRAGQRHLIALPSRRGATHDHAAAPRSWGDGLTSLRTLLASPP